MTNNFFQRVYEVVRRIPAGKVATYGLIADILGTKDARRVGQALHANPDGSRTPCHRVVFADGRLAPGYAFGGQDQQRKKLKMEGIFCSDQKTVNLKEYLWNPLL
ncbi:MGMT family protein [Candidatus Gottesmanbacteria bacterium]|nr:MGMT family protein [Candidatus Gottesmanbacteria bacterium]